MLASWQPWWRITMTSLWDLPVGQQVTGILLKDGDCRNSVIRHSWWNLIKPKVMAPFVESETRDLVQKYVAACVAHHIPESASNSVFEETTNQTRDSSRILRLTATCTGCTHDYSITRNLLFFRAVINFSDKTCSIRTFYLYSVCERHSPNID